MNVKKFSASTSREAWRLVREALGPDAVILSNRTLNGMVEILALANEDMSSLAQPVMEKEVLLPTKAPAMSFPNPKAERYAQLEPIEPPVVRTKTSKAKVEFKPVQVAQAAPQTRPTQAAEAPGQVAIIPATKPLFPPKAAEVQPAVAQATPVIAAPVRPAAAPAAAPEVAAMMSEIRSMRGMIESQLAEIAWGTSSKREPARNVILREMLAAGFSASLARYLSEKLPASQKQEDAMKWVKSILARNLSVLDNEDEILEQGGVFALVGPTGVGKTTTTAKLAARCVMRHGPGKLALITTDGYRIGGYEQLRIYGKILGVMVHTVKDESDLRIALAELKNKHTVLIDTAGVGQRDQMVAEQIAMLQGVDAKVKRLLCMSATSTGETLSEVVRAYQGDGLAGCIITKLDEAATIGNVLDVAIRQKLQLYYVANGQRVPEDLYIANHDYLIDRAFKAKRESAPFELKDDELPLIIANTARATADKGARGVNLG